MNTLSRLNTIRTRLTLWYVLLLAVSVFAFCIYLTLELDANLTEHIDASLRVAASQVLVAVDLSVEPPVLRPMSDLVVDQLLEARSAIRLINGDGSVVAELGEFPTGVRVARADSPFATLVQDRITWRIYSLPIDTISGASNRWLQVAESMANVQETHNSLLRLIVFGIPLMLVVASLGGSFMAGRALSPVNLMTRAVKAIHATDMTRRIAVPRTQDELAELAVTLNSMLDRLQVSFELERRFTADASHELRTPLTAINGYIGVALAQERAPAEYILSLKRIKSETDRLIRVANDLLFLARLDSAAPVSAHERVNLNDLLAAIVEQFHGLADDKQITLNTAFADDLRLVGNTDHLVRLFLNLLDNALKYTPTGGSVTFTARRASDHVSVTVQDTGAGIPAEHVPHLFERFYRVEADRQYRGGSGLGLAIVQQIVREHGGTITVTSTVNVGTTFTVHLPVVANTT